MMVADTLGLLRHLSRSERALLLGQSISVIGDFMAFPAMLNVASGVGDSFLSCFLVVYFLPRCLQPFFGFVADKYNAKSVAITSDLVRAVIFLLLFAFPAAHSSVFWNALWLAAAFTASFFAALFEPARLKVMSHIALDFARYNSLSNFFYSIGGIISLVGALLIEVYFDTSIVFLANAATFAVSLILLVPVQYSQEFLSAKEDLWRATNMWNGFVLLLSHRGVFRCTAFVVLIDFFTGVFFDSFPAKAVSFDMGLYGTYVYYFTVCMGNTLGTLFVGPGLRDETKWVFCCSGALISLCLFILIDSAAISLTACICFFLMQIIAIVSSEMEIQRCVPAGYQGRLFAINESLPFLALSIGSVANVVLGDVFIVGLAAASFSSLIVLALLRSGLSPRLRSH